MADPNPATNPASVILGPDGSLASCVPSSGVREARAPNASQDRMIVYYPTDGSAGRRIAISASCPPHTIRSNAGVLNSMFECSAIPCDVCAKPYVRIQGIDFGFTILMPCYHGEDVNPTSKDLTPNESIRQLLPPNYKTLAGPTIVVKHVAVNNPGDINADLEILSINSVELEIVNELMKRWVVSTQDCQAPPA